MIKYRVMVFTGIVFFLFTIKSYVFSQACGGAAKQLSCNIYSRDGCLRGRIIPAEGFVCSKYYCQIIDTHPYTTVCRSDYYPGSNCVSPNPYSTCNFYSGTGQPPSIYNCTGGAQFNYVVCGGSAPTPTPTPTPTPVPVCKPLGDTCSGAGGNCCSGACSGGANGVCCKANGAACSGGGGSCCSGYCNLSINQCSPVPTATPTPTPTPAVCPNYNGQPCAGNPPGGQCQTSPTCSNLPVGGACSVGGLPGTYAFNLCPGGGETRCCVPNPTPTPTPRPPTPTPAPLPWFKLRDSSLVGRLLVRSPIPALPLTPYDGDDPGRRVLIDNLAGNTPGVLSGKNIEIEGVPASSKGWKVEGRGYEKQYTVQKYIEYVRASKKNQVLEITQINDAVSGKINILTLTGFSPVTLTEGQLNSKRPLLLIVDGDIDFEANINSSNEPQVIMSTGKIDFNISVREANGVYIADSIDFGLTANQGIKVTGNIIALSSFRSERQWGDPKKPGLFIVFDPSHYMAMFDMLSSIVYDWRQIQ